MKKIMSIILALTLAIGLLPTAFASDEAAASDGYSFVFSNAAHTTTPVTQTGESAKTYKFADGYHTIETTTEGYDRWGYVAQIFPYNVAGILTEDSNMRLSFYKPEKSAANSIVFSSDMEGDATAFCLELEVKEGGVFTPSMTYKTRTNAPIVELYLVPKSEYIVTDDNLSDFVKGLDMKYRFGILDAQSTTNHQILTSAEGMSSVSLEDNTNYYFIIVPNDENETAKAQNQNYYYFLPISLDFAPKYSSYTYDFTTNVLDSEYAAELNASIKSKGVSYDGVFTGLTGFGDSATIDLERTTAWSVANTRYVYNAPKDAYYSDISENGLRMFYLATRYYTLSNSNSVDSDNDGVKDTLPALGDTTHMIMVLNIPKAGKYKLDMFNNISDDFGVFTEVSFGAAGASTYTQKEVTSAYADSTRQILGYHDSTTVHNGTEENPAETFTVNVPSAGMYYLLFATPQDAVSKNTTAAACGNAAQTLNLTKITLSELDSEYNAEPGEEEVNVDPGNVEAESEKTTATAVVSASSVDTENNYVDAAVEKTENSVTAPQFAGENNEYEFLYWTKGIGDSRKIVSKTTSHTFDATPGNNIFFAVYRDTTASAPVKATFYNANGDILGTSAVADGKTTTLSLDKVSLPGFGKADGWKLADDDTVYGASTEVTVSDDASFVAYYEEEENTAGISVEDDVIIEIEDGKTSASYGDTVTVTAPLRRNNTEIFNYWTKNGEIVSFDRKYSFCAWDGSCELKAVYTNYVPLADAVRKIILGTITKDNETTVVAEFIGFDNAVERGIAFGTTEATASVNSVNRVVMNRKDLNHIAAIDDIGEGYVGYAIMSDGTVYYSNTDSE